MSTNYHTSTRSHRKEDDEDFSVTLERSSIVNEITNILSSFEDRCSDVHFKKGIYIYGSPGSGKTFFVTNLLTKLRYDVIT